MSGGKNNNSNNKNKGNANKRAFGQDSTPFDQQQHQYHQQQQKALFKKHRSDDASYASQKTTMIPPELDTSAHSNAFDMLKNEDDRTPLGSPATPANMHISSNLAAAAAAAAANGHGGNPPPPPPPPPTNNAPFTNQLAMMQQQQQQQLLQEQEQAAAASAQNSAKPFSCTKCTRSFATNSGLESHVLNVHINKKVYECPQCSKKFSANGSLKRHVETVHNRKRDFQCLRCGKLFALKHHLKNHMITVHHEKNVDLSNVKPITRRQTPSPQHHQLPSHASPPAPSSSPSGPLTSASLAPSARQERRESSYSVSSFSGFSAPFLGMLASNSSANGSSHMPSLLDMGGMLGANATHAAMQSLAGANNSHNDDHSSSAMPTSMYDPNTTADFRNLLGNLNYGLPSQEEDHVQSTLSSLTNPGSNSFVPEDSFASLMSSYNSSYNNRDQAQQRRTSFFETAPVHPFNTFGNGFNSDKSYPGIPSIPSMPSTSSNSGN